MFPQQELDTDYEKLVKNNKRLVIRDNLFVKSLGVKISEFLKSVKKRVANPMANLILSL